MDKIEDLVIEYSASMDRTLVTIAIIMSIIPFTNSYGVAWLKIDVLALIWFSSNK